MYDTRCDSPFDIPPRPLRRVSRPAAPAWFGRRPAALQEASLLGTMALGLAWGAAELALLLG
jgi:hypothetical protein